MGLSDLFLNRCFVEKYFSIVLIFFCHVLPGKTAYNNFCLFIKKIISNLIRSSIAYLYKS